MARARRSELKVSLPCISVVFWALILVLVAFSFIAAWVGTQDPMRNMEKGVLEETRGLATRLGRARGLSLDGAALKYVHAKIHTQLSVAENVVETHALNFEGGLVGGKVGLEYANASRPYSVAESADLRAMLYSSIKVHPQFEFFSVNYPFKYKNNATVEWWGFTGWMGAESYFYTDADGATHVYPAPAGVVNWSVPLYSFPGTAAMSGQKGMWATVPLSKPTGQGAWTMAYAFAIGAQAPVDVYATYGRSTKTTPRMTMNADVNMKDLNSVLREHRASPSSLLYIVESATWSIVACSEASTKLHEGKYSDWDLRLVNASLSSNSAIKASASFLLAQYGANQVFNASHSVALSSCGSAGEAAPCYVTAQPYEDPRGISWVVVQTTPLSTYNPSTLEEDDGIRRRGRAQQQNFSKSRDEALGWVVGVTAGVLLLGIGVTWFVVRKYQIVYASSYNEHVNEHEMKNVGT